MNVSDHEKHLKTIKSLHTKLQWETFQNENPSLFAQTTHASIRRTSFNILVNDHVSRNYSSDLWESLVLACGDHGEWPLVLEIHKHLKSKSTIPVILCAVEALLSLGNVLQASRTIKSLRRRKLTRFQDLRCSLFLAQVHSMSGDPDKAIRRLRKLRSHFIELSEWNPHELVLAGSELADNFMILGAYREAAVNYYRVSKRAAMLSSHQEDSRYLQLQCLLGAIGAWRKSGHFKNGSERPLLNKAKDLLKSEHSKFLSAQVAFLESQFAFDRGDMAAALSHSVAAKRFSSKSSAFLTFNWQVAVNEIEILLESGRHLTALQRVHSVPRLPKSMETSHRLKYIEFTAAVEWQEGRYQNALDGIIVESPQLLAKLLPTTETLELVCRTLRFCGYLGIEELPAQLRNIPKSLQTSQRAWKQYLRSLAFYSLGIKDYKRARQCIDQLESLLESEHDLVLGAWLAHDKVLLSFSDVSMNTQELLEIVSNRVKKLGPHPLVAHSDVLMAAFVYRKGDLKQTKTILQKVLNNKRTPRVLLDTAEVWVRTLSGHTTRNIDISIRKIVGGLTQLYFGSFVEERSLEQFKVSGAYPIVFSDSTVSGRLFRYLIRAPGRTASFQSIQEDVWQEHGVQQGFEQRIHNAVQKIRAGFSPCLVPVVYSPAKGRLALFDSAVRFKKTSVDVQTRQDEAVRMLKTRMIGIRELCSELSISYATGKRLLLNIKQIQPVKSIKLGRKVFYRI